MSQNEEIAAANAEVEVEATEVEATEPEGAETETNMINIRPRLENAIYGLEYDYEKRDAEGNTTTELRKLDLSRAECRLIVQMIIDEIKAAITENIENDNMNIKIPGLCKWRIHHKEAKTRTYPKTGQPCQGHRKRKIRFIPGADLMLLETVKEEK